MAEGKTKGGKYDSTTQREGYINPSSWNVDLGCRAVEVDPWLKDERDLFPVSFVGLHG
jgi:hypothetical protein